MWGVVMVMDVYWKVLCGEMLMEFEKFIEFMKLMILVKFVILLVSVLGGLLCWVIFLLFVNYVMGLIV